MNWKALVLFVCFQSSVAVATNPVQKIIELLTQLESKVIKDGEAEQKAFEEYAEWCETGAKDKEWEIKTAKSEIEDLESVIAKASSDIDEMTAKISDLAGSISTNEADLKAATEIRDKEHTDFAASESELVDAIDTLDRAITVLERKLNGAALMQVQVGTVNMGHLIQTLETVIDAASINSHDKKKLLALAQSDAGADDGTDSMLGAAAAAMGAPDPDAYKSHSGSIIDVLEDMREKAEGQLDEERKAEMNSQHNYDMLKQSLTDEIAVDKKDLAESKSSKSGAEETKATAEGDLAITQKDLADAQKVLGSMHTECMTKAQDHEASVASRGEELKALAEAKKIIASMTGGAEAQAYSFLQVGSVQTTGSANIRSQADLANFEVVTLLKRLAKEQHSTALSQLASKIATTMRFGASAGEDPFVKVKGLISDMIARLIKEGEEEASHKAYCDTEMGKTKKKRSELEHDKELLTAKIDKAKASSAKLKEEVAELQKELAEIAESQAELDKIYAEEKETFAKTKADLEQGLEGVRMALKVLKDYYAQSGETAFLQQSIRQPAAPGTHSASSGAASGIIGMLEVVESDFSKNLAAAISEHEAADVTYERAAMENRVSKAMKEQDVKYKTKEAASLDKATSENESDLEGVTTELDAIMDYTKTLRGQCELKPESYAERAKRREAEISGLKEALAILEGESVFIQRKHKLSARSFRGVVSQKKL